MRNDISKVLLNLPGFQVVKLERHNRITVWARHTRTASCPHCKSRKLRYKEKKEREVRHVNVGNSPMFLRFHTKKYNCRNCKKEFWQQFPGIKPRCRNTEAFKLQMADMHHKGITAKDLSKDHGIGHATVTRWYGEYLHKLNQHLKGTDLPRILGIDEHFFTRRKGYATTFCNLKTHRVFDVVLGRSEAALEHFFRTCKGKENVRVVVIDLSETYRRIVQKHLPNAKIVSDRFHVIRLVNHHFIKSWGILDETGRKNIGLIKLMRQHSWNLPNEKAFRLSHYLGKFPTLEAIYLFKQELNKFLLIKHQRADQFKTHIPKFLKMIKQLQESNLKPLITLGNTLEKWKEEILRMLRFTKTNGITEGFHNKMEMMSRRAYGFRNFQNYRMKVRVACA